VVYAIRAERQEQWWKRALFAGFHRLLASVATTPIPVDAGNFSLIDGKLARQIVALGDTDRYLPGLRSWVGFTQKGIPVRRNLRYDHRPRVSLRGLWRLAKTAIFSFSRAPLGVFHCIGTTSLAAFTLLAVWSLAAKLFTTWAVPGWTSQMLVASFFGAINALGVSMLGEYVTRIYDQVRGRPQYIVARRVSQTEPAPWTEGVDDLATETSLAEATAELMSLAESSLAGGMSPGMPERRRLVSVESMGEIEVE
jgi:dolichol-phosphate mannosyltransferase